MLYIELIREEADDASTGKEAKSLLSIAAMTAFITFDTERDKPCDLFFFAHDFLYYTILILI